MTLTSSIRVAFMAALLSSSGFGQDRPAVEERMKGAGQADGRQAPGYSHEEPNRSVSGNTPQTNSTLQEDGKEGNTGFDLGWLGLLGLAGLFGLARGSSNMARAPGNDLHTHDMSSARS